MIFLISITFDESINWSIILSLFFFGFTATLSFGLALLGHQLANCMFWFI
jgi:hypothetical protein